MKPFTYSSSLTIIPNHKNSIMKTQALLMSGILVWILQLFKAPVEIPKMAILNYPLNT